MSCQDRWDGHTSQLICGWDDQLTCTSCSLFNFVPVPYGQMKFSESLWPGLAQVYSSGCPVSRAVVSDSGWLFGEVPVGRTEGFFPGWCCWAVCRALSVSQGEWKLECICKGGFQVWLVPTSFSFEQGELQVPSQPRDCSCGTIRSRQVPLKPWLLEHEALRGAHRYSWVRIKSCWAMWFHPSL